MNTGAELVQYFCTNAQLKTFNGGWTPLTPSGYASALIHGVKEIQSSIWPAVSQLIITNDAWERNFADIQHSSRIFIGWWGHICLIFLVRMLTLYRVAKKLAHFFVRLICIRLNFIKYWQIFTFISLSKSEEHMPCKGTANYQDSYCDTLADISLCNSW